MTARQKKGIGYFVSAALFALAGGIFFGMETTPSWLDVVFSTVSAIAGVLNLAVVIPNIKE